MIQLRPSLLFWLLLVLWALSWGYSFQVFMGTAPSGDGFARGFNRVLGFLGWQLFAGLFAVGVLMAGQSMPPGLLRLIRVVPVLMAGLLLLVVVGVLIWGIASRP